MYARIKVIKIFYHTLLFCLLLVILSPFLGELNGIFGCFFNHRRWEEKSNEKEKVSFDDGACQ